MKKFKIVVLLICMVITAGVLPAYSETVALWLFDEPPGSPVAIDYSGNKYHLTLGPDAGIVSGGKFGNALDADATMQDGLGAYRYHAEPALNPGDENWTLECWLKAKPEMNGDNRIWGLSGVNYIDYGRSDNLVGLYIASRFLPIDGVTAWNKPTGNLKADNQFHHFAMVYDSQVKQLRHYFDGNLQFKANGVWKDVMTGEAPYKDVVFPPHYPMLQVGMRDALQQWDHHEIHEHQRYIKKFQGYIDEMRFSNEALYKENFTPPGSFAKPFLTVWPQRLSLVAIKGKGAETEQTLIILSNDVSKKWSIHEQVDWLSVVQKSGDFSGGPTKVTVLVDAKLLIPSRYNEVIRVDAPGLGEVGIPVMLTTIEAGQIRNVSNRKQLFIDKRFIAKSENVELHINQPEKVEINFPGAHYPRNIIFIEEKGVWRMYYSPFGNLQHAESTDGVNWTKYGGGYIGYESEEELGKLHPFDFFTAVMYDPVDIPERRYKAFEQVRHKDNRSLTGVYAFYSADGLRFKKAGRVLPILPEGSLSPYWDPNIEKYVVYCRVQNIKGKGLRNVQGNQFVYGYRYDSEAPEGGVTTVAPDTMYAEGYENLRSVARIETDDLLKPWPVSETAEQETMYATPNQVPMVFHADKWDGFSDFYEHSTHIYPYAEDVYLMFPTLFRHFHPSRQPWFHKFDDANGPLETTLAVSRDGINWDRVDRAAYVPIGRNDQKDRGRTMIGLGMVRVGNDLYQYYWYTPQGHDNVPIRPELQKEDPNWGAGLLVVRQRLDGFVSADVDYKGGWITTPPLIFSGNRLLLNHNCGASGTIFVELRDLNDQPIPGYTLADCEEITSNDTDWEVRWQGSGDISKLAGEPLKIHFRMRSEKLYAFQFSDHKNVEIAYELGKTAEPVVSSGAPDKPATPSSPSTPADGPAKFSPAPADPKAIVTMWNFDVAPGSETVPDLSGNGLDLHLGAEGAIVPDGAKGRCLKNTAGMKENINVAISGDLKGSPLESALSGSYTIEGFWKIDSVMEGDTWSTMFKVGRSTGDWTNDTIAAYYRTDGTTPMVVTDKGQRQGKLVPDLRGYLGQWVHLALTYDTSTGEFYWFVNGKKTLIWQPKSASDGFDSGGVPKVALLFDPGDRRAVFAFPGYVDEFRISKGVLYR